MVRSRPSAAAVAAVLAIMLGACDAVGTAHRSDAAQVLAGARVPGSTGEGADGGRAPGVEPFARLDLTRGGVAAEVADPHVIRLADGSWVLYGTSSGDGFEAWSSDDFATWTYEGLVWRPTPGAWHAPRRLFWAPQVTEVGGRWWLHYTANERIGVAVADSPLGPFVDVLDRPLVGDGFGGIGDGVSDGTEASDQDDRAIDAFLLETSSGELVLYVSHRAPLPALPGVWIQILSAIPMIDPATVGGPPQTVLDAEINGWEWVVREGPWVVERDGTFHLTYSGNVWFSTCYAVGEATGPTPFGPFTRRGDNPVLHDDPDVGFYGPGHHSIVEGPDGDVIVFHTKVAEASGGPREVRAAPVATDAGGSLVFPVAPPGDSAPGHSSCAPRTAPSSTTTTVPPTSTPDPSPSTVVGSTDTVGADPAPVTAGPTSARPPAAPSSVVVPRLAG